MPLRIAALRLEDRAAWETLARGYKAFYQTPATAEEYDRAWERLLARDGVFGIAAFDGNAMVGIAHYLFHTSTWAPLVCYLQDMYTAAESRGHGVGRALIEAVAADARARGAARYYWLTQEHNTVARALYDKVARFKGFIRYDHSG
ncbi:MAG: GNAT family N-acetyltransferase [Panacagrimonas sp.]